MRSSAGDEWGDWEIGRLARLGEIGLETRLLRVLRLVTRNLGRNRVSEVTRPLAKVFLIKFWDGQDAHPTRKKYFCGMGILPVLDIFAIGH